MWGGGGYDAGGASQFAGGGFMPQSSPAAGNAAPSPAGGKRPGNNSSLRAITVKQLMQGAQSSSDDMKRIDGEELHSLTLVGKIVSAQEESAYLSFILDDGTGKAKVTMWLDGEETEELQEQRRAEWRVGVYIKVNGNFRCLLDKDIGIVAYDIRPIIDFNEVTYHNLQCIFQHLYFTKGAVPPMSGANGFGGAQQKTDMSFGAPANGGFGTPVANVAAPNAAGMTAVQSAVHAMLNAPDALASGNGISRDQIYMQLNRQFTAQQIDAAIEFMNSEGHAYTTVDDNHFKSTAG